VRIQQVSAWVHEALSPGLQLKCPTVDRYTTDLVLGVAEPVVAIREGFFTFLEMTEMEWTPSRRVDVASKGQLEN
jgi:hypothetical protein